ncbi:MAG: RluA family pseudouridine synthase [Saccharofermentanales bacterium]
MKQQFVPDIGDIRIDTYISQQLSQVSRAYVSQLIKEDKIICNGRPCKPSLKVQPGDVIEVDLPEPVSSQVEPQNIRLDIIFEDEWIAVINKPQGLVVHPAPGHRDGTLVNALLYHYKNDLSDLNGIYRPGIVHRIDKDTSGLLLIVKKNEVHGKIADAISRHEIKRTYLAIVCGIVQEDSGTIDLPLSRNPLNRLKIAVMKDGRHAITHFKVLQRFSQFTYVELTLETGRTHQIRVHLSHIGHPVLGDTLYGGRRKGFRLEGQALHACRLEFTHPATNRDIIVSAPLPPYFQDLLEKLGGDA